MITTALLVSLLFAQSVKLAPVSDAEREPGFATYLKKLKSAVAARDAKALHKLVDEDVVIGGFEEKDLLGWKKFADRWQVDDKDSPVWDVLADLMELGFFREAPRTLVTPYLAWKFPRELDPAEHLVVLRDALPLRATPNRDGKSVATLAFDVVRRAGPYDSTNAFGWVEVETLDGIRGFVQNSNVRSPLMSRAQFSVKANQPRNGSWPHYVAPSKSWPERLSAVKC